MVLSCWPQRLRQTMGNFPDTYLCVDTEYTSNGENGKLLEFGFARVLSNVVEANGKAVLNWYSVPGISKRDLDYDLGRLAARVPGWRFSPDYLRKVGRDPNKALPTIRKFLEAWSARGKPFVAQNGLSADERVLQHAFRSGGLPSFEFPADCYLDTGGLFLAEQIWAAKDPAIAAFRQAVLPQQSETLKSYFKRLRSLRVAGIKWNLDCILRTYEIQIPELDGRHTAAYDSLCLHYVMQHVGNLLLQFES
jgi:hypothetical protein